MIWNNSATARKSLASSKTLKTYRTQNSNNYQTLESSSTKNQLPKIFVHETLSFLNVALVLAPESEEFLQKSLKEFHFDTL